MMLFQDTPGLDGVLPDCFGVKQPWLQFLALEINQLQGTLPPSICQASALEALLLGINALTGTFPSCLGYLGQLASLDLDTNQFKGPIPEELCQAGATELLLLGDNTFTGTLPNCLGNLSRLTLLDLDTNQFYGSVPEELCQAKALEVLQLKRNALTGSLPSCLTTSFPLLETMLLHDNDLSGTVPSEWALPSLISVTLSNNPKLGGSLPASLFLQHSEPNVQGSTNSPNNILHSVVIEGTSIGGNMPTEMCAAPQLVTLAFSGNELTGTLPNCIVSLQNLQMLRVSDNHLTGSLPEAINNMTSLTVLDLSTNKVEGRVPAALGYVSSNLITMQLQLNRLSCDLPASVLEWQASSANVSFNLLGGNLFGCSTKGFSGIATLSIHGAAGLRHANEQAFDAYNCGNSDYVLPVITLVALAVPIVFGLVASFMRGRLTLRWRAAFEWTVNSTTLIGALDRADRQIRALTLGVIAAANLSGSIALVVSLHVAKSAFECEYMASPTLANKGESNMRDLSIGVGAAGCVGLVLGLAPWWRRLVTKCSSSTEDYGSVAVLKNKPLYPFEGDAQA
jgi:Leucine-rich repeat (LRR) protein